MLLDASLIARLNHLKTAAESRATVRVVSSRHIVDLSLQARTCQATPHGQACANSSDQPSALTLTKSHSLDRDSRAGLAREQVKARLTPSYKEGVECPGVPREINSESSRGGSAA